MTACPTRAHGSPYHLRLIGSMKWMALLWVVMYYFISGSSLQAAGPGPNPDVNGIYPQLHGWANGHTVSYYVLSFNSAHVGSVVAVAPLWRFIRGFTKEGDPVLVKGQLDVVDVKPGEGAYSDLWQVIYIQVPAGFQPGSIKSYDQITALDLTKFRTVHGPQIALPIVPAGTRLGEISQETTPAFYKGQPVQYFFTPIVVNNTFVSVMTNRASKAYVIVGAESVKDLSAAKDVVFATEPGDNDYSGFWQLNYVLASATYQPGLNKTVADIQAALASGKFKPLANDKVLYAPFLTSNAAEKEGAIEEANRAEGVAELIKPPKIPPAPTHHSIQRLGPIPPGLFIGLSGVVALALVGALGVKLFER